jgi:hypothetical protein
MPKGVYERKWNPIQNFGDRRGRPRIPLKERLWSKVNLEGPVKRIDLGPCAVWTASVDRKGYGKLQIGTLKNPKYVAAHRLAYELENGPLPPGVHVLHHCDNPPCVRLSHLFLGDYASNAADKVSKGRQTRGPGHPFARLTATQVREIRALRDVASPGKLAKRYGVSYFTVRRVLRGDSYQDVS